MNDKVDLLSRMSLYHEQIKFVEREFSHIITIVASGEIARASEHFALFYQNNFVNHFKFEEMVVFPALLIWSRDRRYQTLVEEYQKLHGELLTLGSTIQKQLSVPPEEFTKELAIALVTSLGKCSSLVLEHARSENMQVVPLLEHHSALRFLSGRNLPSFKMELKQLHK